MIERVKQLYSEAQLLYSNSYRPGNYISQYIKRRINTSEVFQYINFTCTSVDEALYCIVFDIFERPVCVVCRKLLYVVTFSKGFYRTCSSSCSHRTQEYKLSLLSREKKPKSTKGKTYLEIYGTSKPKSGFRSGSENPNYNKLLKEKSNQSLRNYYSTHPEVLERKRELIYSRYKLPINNYKLIFKNSRSELFRSSLEVNFSELLIKNNIDYKYEVIFKLSDGRRKVVDFVVEDFLIVEISGYAYDKWRDQFDEKIKVLIKSTYMFILILTYSNQLELITKNNLIRNDLYFCSVEDESRILRSINFYREIYQKNEYVNSLI